MKGRERASERGTEAGEVRDGDGGREVDRIDR